MSDWDDKLEQTELRQSDSNRARCFLNKHLHYEGKDGKKHPRYTVIREDSSGPVILHQKLMDSEMFWRRVYFDGKDVLFEAVLPGENHEAYYAAPKAEAPAKAKKSPRKSKKKS